MAETSQFYFEFYHDHSSHNHILPIYSSAIYIVVRDLTYQSKCSDSIIFGAAYLFTCIK